MNLQVVSSATGLPTLVAELPDGKQVYVHSAVDPELEAIEWARHAGIEKASTVILCGFGLGYHVRAALERTKERCMILVVEKNRQFALKWLAENPLPETETKKVTILSNDELHECLMHLGGFIAQRSGLVFAEHGPSVSLDPDYYLQSLRTATEAMRVLKVTVNTMIHRGTNFLTNLMQNAPSYLRDPGVSTLAGRIKGKPAILVASGPSLRKHFAILESLQGKVPMFAAGSAYEVLTRRGIYPDAVASVDPHPTQNFVHFRENASDGVTLIYDVMTTPEVVEAFGGPRFAFHHSTANLTNAVLKRLGHIGRLPAGGTVASALFGFMRLLGANPIILVGQDLALTNNESHVPGVTGYQGSLEIPSGGIVVPAWSGEGTVPTDAMLFTFLRYMQLQFKDAQADGVLVIDATEGGARKEGTSPMTLQQALEQYCHEPYDIRPLFRELHKQHAPSVSRQERVKAFSRGFERRARRMLARLHKAEETLAELDRLIEAIMKAENAPYRSSLIRRGDALHEQAAKENEQLLKDIDLIDLVDVSLPFTRFGPRHDDPKLDKIVAQTRLTYRELRLSLETMLEVLEPVNQRLNEVPVPVQA